MTRFSKPFAQACAALLISFPAGALIAQTANMPPMLEAQKMKLDGEIPIYQGLPPGSKADAQPEQWETMGGEYLVRNVTVPTITPVLPAPGTATGAAVLVAPGGAYMVLSVENEGIKVAHQLASHGIAAFVLKYRVDPTPRDIPGFMQAIGARMAGVVNAGSKGAPPIFQPLAIDDAAVALKLIRSRAAEWKIDPNRTGMIGFSAGAMSTLTLTLENRPGARPSFVGIIYGPMLSVTVPPQAPPLFAALASDDPLFGHEGLGLIQSWQTAGSPVELHFFEHGEHGFGMHQQGTSSDLWFEEFLTWMKARKLLMPSDAHESVESF